MRRGFVRIGVRDRISSVRDDVHRQHRRHVWFRFRMRSVSGTAGQRERDLQRRSLWIRMRLRFPSLWGRMRRQPFSRQLRRLVHELSDSAERLSHVRRSDLRSVL